MMHLTFTTAFNAVHRLWSPALSEAENRDTYAECANPSGHGHQYGLEVTVAAPVGGGRPCVISREAVRRLKEEVLRPKLHHANLDTAFGIDGFISTGENVARAIWHFIQPEIKEEATLVSVRVIETHKNSFTYRGGTERSPGRGAPTTAV
ncbi:MAG: 6-carboxytetrahydropterin synthase [Candidatus Krumholzibacteriia bacterium]